MEPEDHHRVHKIPSLVPALSQTNLVHTITRYLTSILILYSHLHPGLPNGSSFQVPTLKLCMHFSSLLYVLYAPPILIYLSLVYIFFYVQH